MHSTNDGQHRVEGNQGFTHQLSMLVCLIRQLRSVLCRSKPWETEKMCPRVLNEEWQEGDGAQSCAREKREKKSHMCKLGWRSGWAEIPHMCVRKISRTDRVDWDVKLQGRRDYWESVNRKKQEQTAGLSFGLQMFEEASGCAADTAGGGQRRFQVLPLGWVLTLSLQSGETRCLLVY